MEQIPLNINDQDEDKNIIRLTPDSPVLLPAEPLLQSEPQSTPITDNAPSIQMNTQNNRQQFKLASTEVQGPKPPLVSGSNSKFVLIAVALIVIIVAGIGGYYFYTKDNVSVLVNSPVAIIPTAAPIVDKNLDSDSDGLPDVMEKVLGTSINNPDSDGDTFSDLNEIKNGYSPLAAGAAGKYSPEEWSNIKGSIKIEDRNFYEREFGASVVSPSPTPEISITPSPATSLSPI